MRAVVLYPGEDGYWIAECSSLPGCVSQRHHQARGPEQHQRGYRELAGDGEAHGQLISEERF
jgi:hypothetical protein